MALVGESISLIPGPPTGPLVANNDHVAFVDVAAKDALKRAFLAFVNFGGAFEIKAFFAGDLADGATGGEVAAEDTEVGVGLDRLVEGANDILLVGVGRVGGDVLEGLGDGLAGDGQAIAVEQPAIEEHFHERANAADADEMGHAVFAERFHVGKERDAGTDGLEVIDPERDLGGMGDSEQVEDEIGRAAERGADGDAIFEGLSGEDIAGFDTLLEHGHDGGTGALAVVALLFADGELGAAVGQAQP
jgi:hypothetical protein